MKTSEIFYKEYIESDICLADLAKKKGIKSTTAVQYISRHYDSNDAMRLMAKLQLSKDTICNAFKTMSTTQMYRQYNNYVQSSEMTPYIHQALGTNCDNHCLATSIIRRLYTDICETCKKDSK